MSRRPFSHQGLGLLHVLLITALLNVLILAMMGWMDYFNKSQRGAQSALDFDILRSQIKMLLDNKSLCKDAFWNGPNRAVYDPTSTPQSDLNQIRVGGNTVARVSQSIGPGLVLSKIELLDSGVAPVDRGTNEEFRAKLVIEATRDETTIGLRKVTNERNPFWISLKRNKGTHVIEDCGDVVSSPALGYRIESGTVRASSAVSGCNNASGVGIRGNASSAATFAQAFTNPPTVFLTVSDEDGNGPKSCRTNTVDPTGFSFECFTAGTANCGADAVFWLAIGN